MHLKSSHTFFEVVLKVLNFNVKSKKIESKNKMKSYKEGSSTIDTLLSKMCISNECTSEA